MSRWLPYAGVALLSGVVASLGTAAALQNRGGESVRAYLLQNPEVLQEAMDRLRLKQVAAQIAPHRQQIETPYAGAWIGAKDGDVTLVQFFDYACGYCKASLPDVQRSLNWVHLATRYPVRVRLLAPKTEAFRLSESAVVIIRGPIPQERTSYVVPGSGSPRGW